MSQTEDFTFVCSNCEAPLAECWLKEKQSDAKKLKAECPHCGDQSFVKEVSSEFFLGSTDYTCIDSLEEESDITLIKTTKAKSYE